MKLSLLFKYIQTRIIHLCNTAYYELSDKNCVLVVNTPIFQFFNRVKSYNLGDDLNYYLIKEMSGKKVFAYRTFYHKNIPNIMAIGSVIDWLGNTETVVWGSGILTPPSSSKSQEYAIKHVVAVRGEKTRTCLLNSGIDCPPVYGDPALLLPLIYNPDVSRVKGRVGIIPHYKDLNNGNVLRLLNEFNNPLLIKIQGYSSWREVIDQILSCEFIISSSLHGLILSDAYDIPNQWVSFSDLLAGGTFKFEDYYSSVGKKGNVVKVTTDTSAKDILEFRKEYRKIKFDPRPLLKACPFEIVHHGILEYMRDE